MKKFLKVFVPILLALCIIIGTGWYLFVYDREFTRDMLLHGARHFEEKGEFTIASWFYDRAYEQGSGSEEIAIELARQYVSNGNYTQAEVTLNRAIRDGAGSKVYIALCQLYVEQDKLMDAVDLLDKISDPVIKEELDALRPSAPTTLQAPGFYNQYISVSVESNADSLYVNANGQYPSVCTDFYSNPITLADGENALYAIGVSDTGLVSPLAIFGYTVGGIIEEVVFSDAAMEQAIRTALNVSNSKKLLSNDLWRITEFVVPKDASDYSDIRHMAFLESLSIDHGAPGQLSLIAKLSCLRSLSVTNTTISADELAVIGQLSALEKLTLNNCMLTTASGLSGLTNVKYLDLGNNTIRNITDLSSLTSLKELYLSRNALQDLSALTSCSMLQKLDVSYNSIVSINALAGLPLLTELNIGNNQISDLSALGKLSSLTELRGDNNAITDITVLSNAKQLTYLDLSDNQIVSLDPLQALNSLTYLYFSRNQVQALPAWKVSASLVTIDGSYNQISDLAPLAGLKSLNNVLMDYNKNIKSIAELVTCPVLMQVNVYGTKVQDVKALTEQSIIVNYNPIQKP